MADSRRFVRVLVVDDYEPFRHFVRATLQARPELRIICEASDGLQAVQKAEELQPDLVLLDIGLPLVKGMEAYQKIFKIVPTRRFCS